MNTLQLTAEKTVNPSCQCLSHDCDKKFVMGLDRWNQYLRTRKNEYIIAPGCEYGPDTEFDAIIDKTEAFAIYESAISIPD
jgi:hypothetical protein